MADKEKGRMGLNMKLQGTGQINLRCDRCGQIVLDEDVVMAHGEERYDRLCAICFEGHHVEGDRCMGVKEVR